MQSKNLVNIIIPAIIIRLVFSAFFFHPDVKKFHYQVQFLGTGILNVYDYIEDNKNVLPNTDTFNYFPGNYYVLGLWNIASRFILGPEFSSWLNDWGLKVYSHPRMFEFMLILKFPYLILDLTVLYLLLRLSPSPKIHQSITLFWLFNPISLYAIYMLGQIDIIPAVLTVGALLLIRNKKLWQAAILLGLGAAVKTYPLLLLPFVLLRTSTVKQFITVAIIGILAFIIPMLPVINSPAFRYTMAHTNLTQFIFYAGLPVSSGQTLPIYILIWGLVFWASWKRKSSYNVLPEFLTLTLAVTLFSHFHAQWIIWSLPFLVLYLAEHASKWPVVLALVVGFFGTVILIPDQFVFLGLFSQVNPQIGIFPSIYDLLKPVADPNFIQSMFHTLLAASGLYIIISVWQAYENK
jgi:hypothetical protein